MSNQNLSNAIRVRVLSEALPYIRKFNDKVIVVKYGGSAMTNTTLKHSFARDVVLLKAVGMQPIIVHGGGSAISRKLKAAGIDSQFVDGLRVTDAAAMEIIKDTLREINGGIAQSIKEHGGEAHSIVADGLLTATKLRLTEGSAATRDLGWVGEVHTISPDLNKLVHHPTHISVIAPLGLSIQGDCYNINADWVASSVAQHLGAEKLIFMTNTAGVLNKQGKLIAQAATAEITQLVAQGTIHGGMLPKVSCALKALCGGTRSVHIIDGRTPHAVLLELLTDGGVGTLIKQ